LRSNREDWSPEELWRAYMQLTEAEAAFRIQKTDLELRPICTRTGTGPGAHPGVFSGLCVVEDAGATLHAPSGQRTAKVFQELADITLVDVVLPTRNGVTIESVHQSTHRAQRSCCSTESAPPQLSGNGPK